MKCIGYLLVLLSLLAAGPAGAQAPGPKGAIVVSAGTNQPGADYNQFGAFNLEYRRARSKSRSYRIGVYYGYSEGGGSYGTKGLGIDSYSVSGVNYTWHHFGLSGALETERPFHRKVWMAAGLEARASYGYQSDIWYMTTYYGPQNPYGTTPIVPGRTVYPLQSFSLQGRPYLGARLYLGTRVLIGLDFGPSVNAAYQFNKRTSDFGIVDLDLTLFTGAFRVGFRL